jgi:hypothetical protein
VTEVATPEAKTPVEEPVTMELVTLAEPLEEPAA